MSAAATTSTAARKSSRATATTYSAATTPAPAAATATLASPEAARAGALGAAPSSSPCSTSDHASYAGDLGEPGAAAHCPHPDHTTAQHPTCYDGVFPSDDLDSPDPSSSSPNCPLHPHFSPSHRNRLSVASASPAAAAATPTTAATARGNRANPPQLRCVLLVHHLLLRGLLAGRLVRSRARLPHPGGRHRPGLHHPPPRGLRRRGDSGGHKVGIRHGPKGGGLPPKVEEDTVGKGRKVICLF